MNKELALDYGSQKVNFKITGNVGCGDNFNLLDEDDDLTKGLPWAANGYTISDFLPDDLLTQLKKGITKIVKERIEKFSGKLNTPFCLEGYHKAINASEELHMQIISSLKNCLPIEQFPIDAQVVIDRVSKICKKNLSLEHPRNVFGEIFCIRIIRPKSNDNNPLHRDCWLDRLRNAINIYVPLAGSNENSSLPIIPGSHYWPESTIERTLEEATVNGRGFTVPAVTGSSNKLKTKRPDPTYGKFMVFSPYLIHGGAVNLNEHDTRVSLEMRFWRKKDK